MKKKNPVLVRISIIITLVTCGMYTPQSSEAQLSLSFRDMPYEIGFNAGPSFFLGDLGGTFGTGKGFIVDLNLPATRYFVGTTATIYPSSWLGLRGALNFGELYGNDAFSSSKDDGRQIRNLDFRTHIFEGYAGLELYPFDLIFSNMDYEPRIRPYGVLGVGFFHFNPQGTYRNPATGQTSWIDLRPLHTEGEGWGPGFPAEYNLWQPNIPAGIGAKYDLSDDISISGELLYRFIFTGYVDDVHGQFVQDTSLFYQHLPASVAPVAIAMANKSAFPISHFSTRGDPDKTNAYFSVVVGISIKFGGPQSWFDRASSETRCPTRW